jgi:hypothetical protein
MPASLCILHDSRDRALARRIVVDLHRRGISARADLGEMRAGEGLAEQLAEGAFTASAGLVLVTPTSLAASWFTRELPSERRDGLLRDWPLIVGVCGVLTVTEPLADSPLVDLTDYSTGLAELVSIL